METYLKITVQAENRLFYDTNKESDLCISASVDVLEGTFDYNSILFNVKSVCDLQSKDKLYFAPGVTIPRVKLKNIYSEFDVRGVRAVEDADKAIIGNKTRDNMIDSNWLYAVETEAFRNFFNALIPGQHMDEYYHQKVMDALEFYQNDKILVTDYTSIRLLISPSLSFCISESQYQSSKHFYHVKSEYVETYKTLQTADLYTEDALLKYINGTDAVVIDKAMYNTLCDMFRSGDTDNTVLAMEIMANSNYFESLTYLLLLFNNWGSRISDQKSRNHVNFKGLCSYLNIHPGSINQDDLCKVLINKNAVNKENMTIVLNAFQDSLYDTYTYFKPVGITFSEEISKILNEQMVITLEEFTPEEAVTETQIEEDVIEHPIEPGFSPFL